MRIHWRKTLAFLALIFVLIVGGTWAGVWLWYHPSQEDRNAIEKSYTLWHTALAEQRFSDAYAIMSPTYRANHPIEAFSRDFKSWSEPWLRLQPGYSLRVHGSSARLYPCESRWLEWWSGPDYEWTKSKGTWFLTGEYLHYVD